MGQKQIIAVDLGATGGRVILATPDGQKIQTEELNRSPNRLNPPARWKEACRKFERITKNSPEIKPCARSGQTTD